LLGLPHYLGFKAVMIGILAHGLYKAALFLCVGTIDHHFHTRIIDDLGGVFDELRAVSLLLIVSALSMAGVPFFFGFVAKEVLLTAVFEEDVARWVLGAVWLNAVLTVLASLILIKDVGLKRSPTKRPLADAPRPTTHPAL